MEKSGALYMTGQTAVFCTNVGDQNSHNLIQIMERLDAGAFLNQLLDRLVQLATVSIVELLVCRIARIFLFYLETFFALEVFGHIAGQKICGAFNLIAAFACGTGIHQLVYSCKKLAMLRINHGVSTYKIRGQFIFHNKVLSAWLQNAAKDKYYPMETYRHKSWKD